MTLKQTIAKQLNIPQTKVASVLDLLDGGNSIPFIARYRKELTGNLDEEQLRAIRDQAAQLTQIAERRETILKAINEQNSLTPTLKEQLLQAVTLTELEDLYLPYKKKRKTRADVARENQLEPLAKLIVKQPITNKTAVQLALPFCTLTFPNPEDALSGARDIIAEEINNHPQLRAQIRSKALKWGYLESAKINKSVDERSVFQLYYQFSQRVDRLQPHQTLALNRGENEKILRLKLTLDPRNWRPEINALYPTHFKHPLASELDLAIEEAAKRLLLPAIERDVRRILTEQADADAILAFARNLRALLTQPPLANHTIMGIDPAFRTGCKIAIIDPTGKLLETTTIYPHPPQKDWHSAQNKIKQLIKQYKVTLITIGNGTASRETEQLIAELTREQDHLHYLIVSEAGASVYSASPLAKKEFPNLNVSIRGAVSIARRVQDPLAELVKIDPQSLGIGLYQHDLNQKELAQKLSDTVESVVNQVGVDINTASPSLLTHVSGIGPKLAEKVVAFREENGSFPNRERIADVPGIGAKTFEQAAGFLRVPNSKNSLDLTAIHPESYPATYHLLQQLNINPQSNPNSWANQLKEIDDKELAHWATKLKIGLPTLKDIVDQLLRPGRDPRTDLPLPILRSDILSIADLKPGFELNGTVRNVVAFGAFIDIGIKQDGLLHRSQIPNNQSLQIGDIFMVKIVDIDEERDRIQLTLP